MTRTGIISVDGHVKASRRGYRDYVTAPFHGSFDDWLSSYGDAPEQSNMQPGLDPAVQWDSQARIDALHAEGVVAEVLFPNGMPFQGRRFEDASFERDPAINREARRAYNRWLVDFCSQAPTKRAGQAIVTFDDIDEAVADIHWAAENGLRGIMMPPLNPGGIFFFDPVLDPVWAACQDTGLTISQHGGAGTPDYQPAGYAAIMTIAIEQSFFAGRSLWQMILGGVFDRFPKLQVVWVETGSDWIAPVIRQLDWRFRTADDWAGFAVFMQRAPQFTKLASEYWQANCHAGLSPFLAERLTRQDPADYFGNSANPFQVMPDKAMFGVDYPHFEAITPHTRDRVSDLLREPSISLSDARGVLCDNAAQVYGFDLAALAPDIAAHGLDLAALAA